MISMGLDLQFCAILTSFSQDENSSVFDIIQNRNVMDTLIRIKKLLELSLEDSNSPNYI